MPAPAYFNQVKDVDGLVCAGLFDGPLRTAIHNFKYSSDTPLAAPLAALIAATTGVANMQSSPLLSDSVLVPVPLHRDRQRMRGYNQSELLARELARQTGWKLANGMLRVRYTRSQVGLSVPERHDNVSGAFSWEGEDVPGTVILVDDVCTSGATLTSCATTLKARGVRSVYALTVARAVGQS
jgi:ComF family protein